MATASQNQTPLATPVDADSLVGEVQRLGITHVITVPDSYQKTFLARMASLTKPRLITVCTEDEGVGVNAGLYIGGQNPMMAVQNNGIYACMNTLKAIALDAQVPTLLMVGQFARDVTRAYKDDRVRAVRMLEPTLDTWGIPYFYLNGPQDLGNLEKAYNRAQEEKGPAVLIVGAPTS